MSKTTQITTVTATENGVPVVIAEGEQCAYVHTRAPKDGDSDFGVSCRKLYDETNEEN